MASTISVTTSVGITLTNNSYSPVTVIGTVTASEGAALTAVGGSGAYDWTIDNSGVLSTSDTAAGSFGVMLGSYPDRAASGAVTNESGGTIAGYSAGIAIYGPASVTNQSGGTITSNGHNAINIGLGVGSVVNQGIISATSVAVYEYGASHQSGSVTNLSGGTLSGARGVVFAGVGTFTNAGVVIGTNASYCAVTFAYNNPTNQMIADPGASFQGSVQGGNGVLELDVGNGSVGTLDGIGDSIGNFSSLVFGTGATWSVAGEVGPTGFDTIAISGFTSNDTIDVTNFAAVSATYSSGNLVLTDTLSNTTTLAMQGNFSSSNFHLASDQGSGTDITFGSGQGRTISGTYASGITLSSQLDNPTTLTSTAVVYGSGGYGALYGEGGGTNSWTIDNSGQIIGTLATNGVALGRFQTAVVNGVVINESNARIAGAYYGVVIYGAGTVTNASGATISADGDAAVKMSSNYGTLSDTLVNYGVITNTGAAGFVDINGVSLVNEAGATISGTAVGAEIHASSTLTNAGTIIGGTYAVNFTQSQAGNRIIVDPGAAFVGTVTDGYGVMELAVGNGDAGTLGTLGATGITNIGTLQFDSSAKWTVIGDPSSKGLGALTITGFTSNDTIDLQSFVAVSDTFASNALVLTDASSNHATLHIQGNFTSANFLYAYDGSGGTDITFQVGPRNFTWTATGTADWNTPTAWDLGSVPTNIDSAVIGNAGNNVVTVGTADTVNIIMVTVAAGDTLSIAGIFNANSIVDNAMVAFAGSELLNETPLSLAGSLAVQSGGTLTIGSNEIINQTGSSAVIGGTPAGSGTIVNQGLINGNFAGGSLAVVPGNFDNEGTIAVSNEALTIGYDNGSGGRGSWSNGGVIALSGTASLILDGSVITSGIGTITGASSVTEQGIIDNTGATLNVGSGTDLGTVNLANGAVVSNGTIVDHGNGFTFSNGSFNNVTYVGPLNISTSGGKLNIDTGLTVYGTDGVSPGTINLTEGNYASIFFYGTQTIDNATINLNGTDGFNPLTELVSAGGTGLLTLGPNLTVNTSVTNTQADITGQGGENFDAIVNDGTINASAQGGRLLIGPNEGFTNNGTISISNGDLTEIEPGFGNFVNAATAAVSVTGNSELEIYYSGVTSQFSNLGTITLGSGSTFELAGGPFFESSLGTIVNQGATTVLSGEFDDQGGTMTLGADSEFNQVVLSGNLRNATVLPNGNFTIAPAGNASLLDVTYEGPLNLTSDFTNLTLYQGVTVTDSGGNQPGTINVTGQDNTIAFTNQTASAGGTLDNTIINIGNAITGDNINASFLGGTLTIGANATIISSTTNAMATFTPGFGTTTDLEGTLSAIGNGGTFTINGVPSGPFQTTFDNDGMMVVGNGDTLNVASIVNGGTGTTQIGTGGIANFASAVASGQTIAFADATGSMRLSQPGSFAATIMGFSQGNTIDLGGITANAATWSSGQLAVSNNGTTVATLLLPQDYSADVFGVASDGQGGSLLTITATCYAAGTRILTLRGEITVERLRVGDLVMTVSGGMQPIRWIGQRRVNFARHPNRRRVLPVRIAAHAFGAERPKRDLLLSPDHAVFVQDVLIPIRFLINGTTIAQVERRSITYYHIELPRHDVLLADGMPAESYLEAGARDAFVNGDAVVQLHPDFTPPLDNYAMLWELYGYAPLVVTGEVLERVRLELADRARQVGWGGDQSSSGVLTTVSAPAASSSARLP